MASSIGDSIAAIGIIMAVAAMCLTTCYVGTHKGNGFMVTILLMMIVSSIVRVIERFNYTEVMFDPESDYYGVIVGAEISIAWTCCLLAEWFTAMKYFEVSSQVPAIIASGQPLNSIQSNSTSLAKSLGGVANLLVSIWPGFLYACTYYKETEADMKSIFWEFEISIWLNGVCRAISLIVFMVALCRIGSVVKNTPGMESNGTMLCLNWTLLIFTTTVQVSLIIFYSMGLLYEEDSIFQNYTSVMMFVNVACTCFS